MTGYLAPVAPIGPPYPRTDARPLHGLDLLRFRLRLLALGHLTVASFQRTMVWQFEVGVLVDDVAGPQTWYAYWELHRHLGVR